MFKFGKILFLLVLLVPRFSVAHGPVTTQSRIVGNYDIEFEYSTLGSIFTGDYTLYDVYLLKPDTKEPIDFSSVFIKFTKADTTSVLSATLAESAFVKGYANLSATLTDPGTYAADVSFYNGENTIAKTTFNFNVESSPEDKTQPKGSDQSKIWIWIVTGLVAAGISGAGFYLLRKKL